MEPRQVDSARHRNTVNSGCFKRKHHLEGQKFNRLTAIEHIGGGMWSCVCECGTLATRSGSQLLGGFAKSCGCFGRDSKAARDKLYGRGLPEKRPLTHDALLEAIHYDPLSGVFTWIRPTAQRCKVGDIAGRRHGSKGYWAIHIGGRTYPAHHVAWFYVYGRWPENSIDHRNLNRGDNRIENLREATHGQNRQNTRMQRNNTSGFKGVIKRGGKWVAGIMVDKVSYCLGRFDNAEEASQAYLAAKRKYHSHYVEGQGVRA